MHDSRIDILSVDGLKNLLYTHRLWQHYNILNISSNNGADFGMPLPKYILENGIPQSVPPHSEMSFSKFI